EAGPLDELGLAQVERTRAELAFDMRRGRDAPPLLLRAAQRLASLDPELARDTYLEALLAATYAARLADGMGRRAVALAAPPAPPRARPTGASRRPRATSSSPASRPG